MLKIVSIGVRELDSCFVFCGVSYLIQIEFNSVDDPVFICVKVFKRKSRAEGILGYH